MKKMILLAALICAGTSLFAHGLADLPEDSTKQFLLIVRYKINTQHL
jgi:hypothetical protein